MTSADQDQPLDVAAYRHQLLLLKSAHCCRPVLHDGLYQFINGLTLHQSSQGSGMKMTVYLAGKKDGFDSTEIQIKKNQEEA